MRQLLLLAPLVGALVVSVLAACSSSDSTPAGADADDGGSTGTTTTTPTTLDAGTTPTFSGTGLPCDVEGVFANRCAGCHSTGPIPVAIGTYDALMARSADDPSMSVAQRVLVDMQNATMPRPPAQPAAADEIESVAAWLDAGAPRNATSCTDTITDAGAGMDGGDAGVRCTSGKTWTQGDKGDDAMHPGGACLACHQRNGGPNLRIAGTVYPSLHEPTDCNGSPRPPTVTVIVTDSRNRQFRLNTNDVGNFSTRDVPKPPLKVVVTDGKNTRAMQGRVTSGDCNGCHTEAGANGAPGRIMAPSP